MYLFDSQFSGIVNDSLTVLGYNFNSNGDSYCQKQYVNYA
jgi:hypothetical protein